MIPITVQRLHHQQLHQTTLHTPGDVVAWLGAVQAQEYLLAKWALGLRLHDATDAAVEQAFTEGSILRTHVMRPTWHFVTPTDIRWMLELTAPQVNAVNAYMYRKLELDDALFIRTSDAIAQALEGGHQLTRSELASVLEKVGIVADGMRLGYIVHRAELDAIVCSGARRGSQFTYALLDERAPNAQKLTRDEALAELTRRYFTSHGPAMMDDFVWWSGLTKADVKTGLELCKSDLVSEVIDGQTYWRSSSSLVIDHAYSSAYLLPPYDEFTNYRDSSAILDPQYLEQLKSPSFIGILMVNFRIVGTWRRTISKRMVVIETAPFYPLSTVQEEAMSAAAQRYGDFLEMPFSLVVTRG